MIWYESKSMKSFSPKLAFEAGKHLEIVDRISSPGKTSDETAALIGALSFLGRLDEALMLWKLKQHKLTKEQCSRVRFALALAKIRLSKFKSAKRLLKESLQCSVASKRADVFQGIAIFHYYRGDFEKAVRFSQKALEHALALGDSYIHAFALDLNGHSLAQTGRRSAGIQKLKEALSLSKRREAYNPFSLAILLYEAEAGLRPHSMVGELETALKSLPSEDSYSKANLSLELAQQLTIRGNWKEAQQTLDSISSDIYGFENRRQEAVLQIRLGELACLRGEYSMAAHFAQSAKRCVEHIADRSFVRRIEELENRTKALSSGEAFKPTHTVPEILEAGFLGLLGQALNLNARTNHFLIFDDGAWVALSKDGSFQSTVSLSKQNIALLRALGAGIETKENLVSQVWGYGYESLRHDSLLYSAIASLRKSLGPIGHWIESRDSGWSFRNLGQIVHLLDGFNLSEAEPSQTPTLESPTLSTFDSGLNWRQLKALRKTKTSQPWTVPAYRQTFQVSTMTAWRDLDGLEKSGYLKRIGRGRATVYAFETEKESK